MTILTPEQFEASDGTDEWRVIDGVAWARFATGSFARGVELVNRIGALADAANHHPDVDLRYPTVTVRLVTHDADTVLTELDLDLARQISEAAAELGVSASPVSLDQVADA